MFSRGELLALLFYVVGGFIRGTTRLQKIVFLVQEEVGLGDFRFTASKYGPWSKELEDLVHELVRQGELKVKECEARELQERPARVYEASKSLMERGREAFNSILRSDPALALKLYTHVRTYAALPITYLLAYVYKKYPEYTVQSIIREQVREWQERYGLRSWRETKT